MVKKKSLKTLKEKAAKLFQLYVRLRDTDDDGYGNCCSCGKNVHYKSAHGGHFVSRKYLATMFDERNVNIQCAGCNAFNSGCPDGYALFIIRKYGPQEIERLNSEKTKSIKLTQSIYEDMIEKYTSDISELMENKGLS